ncbi:hypothetical protein VB714_23000 [Spirulina sp. 06S082]|nr:hypothetical protein [Spirulina sp. 06S082]
MGKRNTDRFERTFCMRREFSIPDGSQQRDYTERMRSRSPI